MYYNDSTQSLSWSLAPMQKVSLGMRSNCVWPAEWYIVETGGYIGCRSRPSLATSPGVLVVARGLSWKESRLVAAVLGLGPHLAD